MIDGIINVYKEAGYTSFDVVAKLRGILKQKKIGHTGTLDPMAEGVLIVCLGKGTKLVDMITSGTKEYEASMRLGITTDTEDITGQILSETVLDSGLTHDKVIQVINSFVGKYNQIPPMYSAIKKDGKKLYEYARSGVQIEREPRPVEIFSIDDISVQLPNISFKVNCSKGTYIRSLCRDIGDKLQCGGTLTGLTRSEVHGFWLKDSLKLSDIERLRDDNKLMDYVLPVDSLLKQYSACSIKDEHSKLLYNGNKLYGNQLIFNDASNPNGQLSEIIRVYHNDEFIALYQYNNAENNYKPYKMFL
ncbi:MAG: tRNA pseudouridine(55) synthase TruB [Lachnospiraceae bacterium]|nr:tRNA pseudouridine(55) synthase TruB [Lachnospiraceae bacterium]